MASSPSEFERSGMAMKDRVETTRLEKNYRLDLRDAAPDVFRDFSGLSWDSLSWKQVGRPSQVTRLSARRRAWEEERGRAMPVSVQWEHFNRHFHGLFSSSPERDSPALRRKVLHRLGQGEFSKASETVGELLRLQVWNRVHRVEDAVWDPRGKRALFEGLPVVRPRILFIGAADGYEAMQLSACYPGGEALLVDSDEFCRTHRFGRFPESYPFLGADPATGGRKVYRRGDMSLDFLVEDAEWIDFGPEFDIVISVGFIEHFADDRKPEVIGLHRRFLKPGGFLVMTTPRRQWRSRLFYRLMAPLMNFGYRELMDVPQMGLYLYENGLKIRRAGHIKAHNGIVAQVR